MSPEGYALLGLTALVASLVAVLVYAVLRFGAAARAARQHATPARSDGAFLAGALQEAVGRLRAHEQQMQARAEASERLSDQIVASMSSGLLLVDLDGRVGVVNPAACRLLGVEPSTGGDYRALLAGAPALRDVLQEALRDGRPVLRRSIQLGSAPGKVTHLGLTVSPVTGPDDRLRSVVCLFSDLSAVVALEEQVRLKDGLARLGELTAGIAHEFRNGLATIHGYARLIDLGELKPPYDTYVQGIRAETEALGQVVANFLNFARPVPLSLGDVDLRVLAERAGEEIRREVAPRGGTVEVVGEFAEVLGDDVLLRQALSNLCRNAAEACLSVSRPPAITIAGRLDPGWCHVMVSDNGPGIDPSAMERIFQPFVTTKGNGTGLGLALVQKIVVTHNGRVSAVNRPDGGAAFEVSLPLPDAAARVHGPLLHNASS